MALDSNALMLAGKGYLLINEPGVEYEPTVAELEAFAADTTKLPKGSQILGHTSRNDLVAMGKDGGDSTVLGSWEQEQIDTIVTKQAVEYLDAHALEFKNSVLELFYGGGDSSQPGRFAVPKTANSPKKSLTVVYLSRGQVRAQFFPVTSVAGNDVMKHAVDNWSTIPLRFTILDPVGGGDRQVWIGRTFGQPVVDPAPSGTTSGTTGGTTSGTTSGTTGGTTSGTTGGTTTPAPTGPTLSSVAPTTGSTAGGETITLTGTSLTGATGVTFGGDAATSVTVVSDTQVTAVAPAHAAGAVDVVVTTAAGTSTLAGAYTYA